MANTGGAVCVAACEVFQPQTDSVSELTLAALSLLTHFPEYCGAHHQLLNPDIMIDQNILHHPTPNTHFVLNL